MPHAPEVQLQRQQQILRQTTQRAKRSLGTPVRRRMTTKELRFADREDGEGAGDGRGLRGASAGGCCGIR